MAGRADVWLDDDGNAHYIPDLERTDDETKPKIKYEFA